MNGNTWAMESPVATAAPSALAVAVSAHGVSCGASTYAGHAPRGARAQHLRFRHAQQRAWYSNSVVTLGVAVSARRLTRQKQPADTA